MMMVVEGNEDDGKGFQPVCEAYGSIIEAKCENKLRRDAARVLG